MREELLKTEVAEGIPRHCKVTRGFPELPTMTADGRVRRWRSLSFHASPPDVPLSSIWADGDSEGSDGAERSSGRTIYVNFRLRKHTWSSERISTEENISGSWKTGIGSETIMWTEIEHEECDVKWNGTGFGVRGSERGLGTGNMKQANTGTWNAWGNGIRDGDMNEYAEMIKQGIMGRTEPDRETQGGYVPDPKLGQSSEGDLGRSRSRSWWEIGWGDTEGYMWNRHWQNEPCYTHHSKWCSVNILTKVASQPMAVPSLTSPASSHTLDTRVKAREGIKIC